MSRTASGGRRQNLGEDDPLFMKTLTLDRPGDARLPPPPLRWASLCELNFSMAGVGLSLMSGGVEIMNLCVARVFCNVTSAGEVDICGDNVFAAIFEGIDVFTSPKNLTLTLTLTLIGDIWRYRRVYVPKEA